jgi:hypothetical protein
MGGVTVRLPHRSVGGHPVLGRCAGEDDAGNHGFRESIDADIVFALNSRENYLPRLCVASTFSGLIWKIRSPKWLFLNIN